MVDYTDDDLRFADDEAYLEDFPLREGLTFAAKKEAEFLYTIARGVMLATGDPGSGKDLLGIALAAMNKYYFGDLVRKDKPRRILLDFLPRRAFGEYTPFNADVMLREIDKMAKAANVEGIMNSTDPKEQSEFITESTVKWVTEKEGELLFKGAFWYLSELKRYCYNRNPHNPFNKFIGAICTVWRHLDLLVYGTHVQKHEIDRYSFLPYVTHWAKCSWSMTRPDTTDAKISRGKFIGATQVYNATGRTEILHINGREPRHYLDGKCFFDLYYTKSMVNLKPVVRKGV